MFFQRRLRGINFISQDRLKINYRSRINENLKVEEELYTEGANEILYIRAKLGYHVTKSRDHAVLDYIRSRIRFWFYLDKKNYKHSAVSW